MSRTNLAEKATGKVTVPGAWSKSRRRAAFLKRKTPYLLILPAIVLELLIHIVPSVAGVFTSLFGLDEFYIRQWFTAPFVGISNYKIALNFSNSIGTALVHSFTVTILYTIVVVAFSWFLGFSAALILQQAFKGRGLLRTIFLIPYAMPVYAGVIVWNFMLQRDNGLVNHVLVNDLHLFSTPPFWLLGNNAFFATAAVAIWRLWPFAFLMTMAGMQSISGDVYEAASLDGAGTWKRTFYITLGLLRPVTAVLLLMMFLWTFNDFNTPFVLFGTSPPPSVDLISIHIYENSFVNWNFGLGAAMSVLMLVFLLVVTGLWFLWDRKGQRHAA
jgi:multiple sugar transport system permease protein